MEQELFVCLPSWRGYNGHMEKEEKIILVSDNHGQTAGLQYLRDTYKGNYSFIHCGDAELPDYLLDGFLIVQGNNDMYQQFPMNRIITLGDHRIYVCHGHRDMFYGQFDMLADRCKELGCDIGFFGHSHVPFDKTVDGVRLLNPGSIWHNRDGSDPSYMIVTLKGKDIEVQRMTFKKEDLLLEKERVL